ncbi:hypothetical protein ABFW14_05955 [Mycolicibacterium fortuitum]|jgi:hypothetical protein|uniref:hypothetical protein n=1 Tax=Mycolicibacterium TaxID=1866885 RepID=UPI0007ED09AA|nr:MULTISPECIES: hypothetical protein [Mycolicibacterium]OBK08219.1 hypothetical protein A5637_32040 [Mycolicibacterium fortuitum]OMC06473.1 hypothetical protein A5734_05330 [Mycolicibacterium fortuitum]
MSFPIEYQADHTLLLALPAFAPAVVVVGVVVYVAMRDRRRGEPRDDDSGDVQDEDVDLSDEDGSP